MSTQQPLRTDFATRLRSATLAEHDRIQSTPFMRALLAGELEADAYAVMLAQNYFIYQALEESADFMRADLIAGPFVSDRLHRTAALEADLHYHLGPDWKQVMSPSEPTERYRSRIREVCFEWSGGFVAHHYTRYLGDLSGGQAIRRIMSRELATGGEGFACHRFDAISNPARFKRAYRTLLDTAGWGPTERKLIIAEVRLAYQLTIEVLGELGRRLAPRIPHPRR